MNNVFASVQDEKFIADGAGSTGFNFNTLMITGAGDVAISRDGGSSFITYPSALITPAAWFNVSAGMLGTLAQGTTATGIVLGAWGR